MTHDSENWEQLQELFHLAAVTREEDRERVLTERCPAPRLRRRVMAISEAPTLRAKRRHPEVRLF
jgi:hypothetical protein